MGVYGVAYGVVHVGVCGGYMETCMEGYMEGCMGGGCMYGFMEG